MVYDGGMNVYEHNYKNKHYVLADEPEYPDQLYIPTHHIDLDHHAEWCLHYGIPMYIGDNPEFQKQCDEAMNRAVERDKEYAPPHKRREVKRS
jgi:hypothetical protein